MIKDIIHNKSEDNLKNNHGFPEFFTRYRLASQNLDDLMLYQ
jgi:hypothetical protein